MHGHLVAVEVSVERGAYQRMDLDRLAFDQDGLERLDTETVQCGCAVQHDRVFLDDLLEEIPDFRSLLLDHLFCRLDGRDEPFLLELVVDEWLEQLQGHLLRKTALVQLQLRAHHDDGTTRVIDALAEKILSESPLLSLERVGQRLERAVVGATQHRASAAIVEQGVHRLLEHSLLVAHDDVRRTQLEQLLEPVVAVDDPAVQIVEIGCREPSAIQWDERAKLGWNHRDHFEDHPLGLVARLSEGLDHLEPLGELETLLLRLLVLHLYAELFGQLDDIHALCEQLLDRLGAHLRDERVTTRLLLELATAVLGLQLPVTLLGEQLAHFELHRRILDLDDDERFEVENLLEVAKRDVEQVSDAAGQPLEEPHMRDRRGQLDMPHPLATDLRLRHLDAALVADDAAVFHPLELSAETLPVDHGAEDLRAEESVPLGLECAVIDGLRLRHLAVRPGPDFLRRSQTDPDALEVVYRSGF